MANRLSPEGGSPVAPNLVQGYEVLEMIGEGGMATVYKVKSNADQALFAIKVLKSDLAKEPGAVNRFKQEVKAAAKLTHPNLVATYEIGETRGGTPFFVMDFVDGRNLSSMLLESKRLNSKRVLEILIPVCEAIEHAHSKGVVHRDIKPSNILISKDGLIKVVDFGIAKVAMTATTGNTGNLTQTGEVFGSPLYMSPEQCMGEPSDVRSDIYSLGCVMYELLVGDAPFQGANPIKIIFGHINSKPAAISKLVKNEGDKRLYGLEAIILRCLEKKPEDRYQTVRELHDDLESVLNEKTPVNALNSPARRRSLMKNAAIIVGLIGVACGAGYFTFTGMTHSHVSETPAPSHNSQDMDKLVASFSNEIRAHPDEEYWYIMRGITYRESGQLTNALMDFTMAISKNPKSAKAYRERGWTYAKLEDWNKAIENNTKAIELDPKLSDAYIGRARDYIATGEFQKSYDDASKAIELNQHNPTAYLNRATASFEMSNYKQCMADCDSAVALDPADPHLRILRSRVAEKLHDYSKGIDDLTFILSKKPDDVPRRVERAYLFNQTGKFDQAIADADKAREIDAKHMGTYIAKATALEGLGRRDEAFAEFQKGLSIDPLNSEIYKKRGDVRLKLGEIQKAIADYDEALKLWPGYREADEARSRALSK